MGVTHLQNQEKISLEEGNVNIHSKHKLYKFIYTIILIYMILLPSWIK